MRPARCASTSWSMSSLTRNSRLGRASTTSLREGGDRVGLWLDGIRLTHEEAALRVLGRARVADLPDDDEAQRRGVVAGAHLDLRDVPVPRHGGEPRVRRRADDAGLAPRAV